MAEFKREFAAEPAEALEWAFRAWRKESGFFPAISDIQERLLVWHRVKRFEAEECKHREEKRKLEEARAKGQLVSFHEVIAKLKDIAKMPGAGPQK